MRILLKSGDNTLVGQLDLHNNPNQQYRGFIKIATDPIGRFLIIYANLGAGPFQLENP